MNRKTFLSVLCALGAQALVAAPGEIPLPEECFTDRNFFTKDSPLVPSGLLGPVELR